jgi:hypothetical protein
MNIQNIESTIAFLDSLNKNKLEIIDRFNLAFSKKKQLDDMIASLLSNNITIEIPVESKIEQVIQPSINQSAAGSSSTSFDGRFYGVIKLTDTSKSYSLLYIHDTGEKEVVSLLEESSRISQNYSNQIRDNIAKLFTYHPNDFEFDGVQYQTKKEIGSATFKVFTINTSKVIRSIKNVWLFDNTVIESNNVIAPDKTITKRTFQIKVLHIKNNDFANAYRLLCYYQDQLVKADNFDGNLLNVSKNIIDTDTKRDYKNKAIAIYNSDIKLVDYIDNQIITQSYIGEIDVELINNEISTVNPIKFYQVESKPSRKSVIEVTPNYTAKGYSTSVEPTVKALSDHLPITNIPIAHNNDYQFASTVFKIKKEASQFSISKTHNIFVNDNLLKSMDYNPYDKNIINDKNLLGRIMEVAFAFKAPQGSNWANRANETGVKFDFRLDGISIDVKCRKDPNNGLGKFDRSIVFSKNKICDKNLADLIVMYSVWEDGDMFYFKFRGWISKESFIEKFDDFQRTSNDQFIYYQPSLDKYCLSINAMNKI